MANSAKKICFAALIIEGSTSAFFPRDTLFRLQNPLKNAYLETLTVSQKNNIETSPTDDCIGSTIIGSPTAVFPTQIPVADNGGDKTNSLRKVSSTLSRKSTEEMRQQIVDVEVLPQQGSPTAPEAIQNTSGWTQKEPEKLRDAKRIRKASYESEREKFDQSFREQNFRHDGEMEDGTVQATVVEVLPKDPPLFRDFLASKNMELERENSNLQRENERQKFELESFLRDSLSDPLEHHMLDNGAHWHGDSLVEANSWLKSENEMQRHDLQTIQSEMKGMESIIQSIENKSFMETQKLENLNSKLQNENDQQKLQVEAYSQQMRNMQNLVQTIRAEAVALKNEKRNLQSDYDLLTTKLRGSEGDNKRQASELRNRNEQISDLQNVIETLRSDYSKLQDQQDLLIEDKVTLESKFDETVREFEKQQYELEAYKKDRASMESLVDSIRQESEALKNEKKELQTTIINMKVALEDMSQELKTTQNKIDVINLEKEEMVTRNQEGHSRLQSQLQDSFYKVKQIYNENTEIEIRLQSLEKENERQRYELENSSTDKRALEVMVQSMQNESEALKSEKATLETTLLGLQQEKQKLDHQLSVSKDQIERLQSEKDGALSQSNENYSHYQQLQLRFQEVLDELEVCQYANMDYDGVDEDFMSRINSRQQNQMRRNQVNEPLNGSWWN